MTPIIQSFQIYTNKTRLFIMENTFNQNSNLIKKDKRHTYYIKSIFMVFIFLFLILLELFKNGGYADEFLGIACAVYLLFFRRMLDRHDAITITLIFGVIIIGLISNIVSGLTSSISDIGIDVVAETKLLFAFFAVKYFLSNKEKMAVINMLVPVAKLYTIAAFGCSLISLVTDIGMSGSMRYGIRSFKFVFDFNFQYVAVYMLIFGILVCNTRMTDRKKAYYYAMAIVSLVLATKSPPIMFSIMFVALFFYFKKHDHLSPGIIILGLVVLAAAGWFQIETYLLNENSPRHLFFEYAGKTANRYFPLGSGFATFGSDRAARSYSQLYYQYGFDKLFGMNPDDSSFLSDTFWPMALGQFGWIGGAMYLAIFVRIFLSFSNKDFDHKRKAFLYAAFLQYMIHAVGAAILSSSAGLIGFMAIAIFTLEENDAQKVRRRVRIHF